MARFSGVLRVNSVTGSVSPPALTPQNFPDIQLFGPKSAQTARNAPFFAVQETHPEMVRDVAANFHPVILGGPQAGVKVSVRLGARAQVLRPDVVGLAWRPLQRPSWDCRRSGTWPCLPPLPDLARVRGRLSP